MTADSGQWDRKTRLLWDAGTLEKRLAVNLVLSRTGEFQRRICSCAVNIAMTSNHLSFASVEMDKNYSLTLPRWKSLCHRWSLDQPQQESSPNDKGRQRRENLKTRLTGSVDTAIINFARRDGSFVTRIVLSRGIDTLSNATPWPLTSLVTKRAKLERQFQTAFIEENELLGVHRLKVVIKHLCISHVLYRNLVLF